MTLIVKDSSNAAAGVRVSLLLLFPSVYYQIVGSFAFWHMICAERAGMSSISFKQIPKNSIQSAVIMSHVKPTYISLDL